MQLNPQKNADANSVSGQEQRPGSGGWRRRLAKARDEQYWSTCTREHIARMTAIPVLEQRAELKNYINWLEVTSAQRADIDVVLLVEFAEQFAQIVKILGPSSDAGIIIALDQAIDLVGSVKMPTTTLHLAKAACCGRIITEHSERKAAMMRAVESTKEGSDRWADAMLALSQYYTDVSQYDRALGVVAEIRQKLSIGSLATRYECGAIVYEAYARIASMRDLTGAEQDLERALVFEPAAEHHAETAMWVSMAYYQKGRLAQIRREYPYAVSNYFKAKRVRERWARDHRTFGFIHLRIAESLISDGQLTEAKKYLDLSSELFDLCSDRGSGWLQCCLARAAYEVACGRPQAGIETLGKTRLEAKQMGFYRGELLCLGRLAELHIRRCELRATIKSIYGMIRTGLDGELRKNGSRHLLRQLPTLVRTLSTRR